MFFLPSFYFNAKFLGLFSHEEMFEILEQQKQKTGVFQNKFNNKIVLCIGICVDNNIFSKRTMNYFASEVNADRFFLSNLISMLAFPILKQVVSKIINNINPDMTNKERLLNVYVRLYLDTLSKNNFNEAIQQFVEFLFHQIDILFFTVHFQDTAAKTLYGLKNAPAIFAFVDGGFLDIGQQKTKVTIYSKYDIIDNKVILTKVLSDILEKLFFYYINVVLDLSNIEKNSKIN